MALMSRFLLVRFFCCLPFVFLLSTRADAHPFHTTTAEMEFNSSTCRFEVSLKVPAGDFELMVHSGAALLAAERSRSEATDARSIQLKESEPESLAARYIEKQFAVNVAGKACRLEWLGIEDDVTSKWLYFELIPPNKRALGGDLTLTNKVLCDHNKGQINTVVFISKAARVSLKTHELSTIVSLPDFE